MFVSHMVIDPHNESSDYRGTSKPEELLTPQRLTSQRVGTTIASKPSGQKQEMFTSHTKSLETIKSPKIEVDTTKSFESRKIMKAQMVHYSIRLKHLLSMLKVKEYNTYHEGPSNCEKEKNVELLLSNYLTILNERILLFDQIEPLPSLGVTASEMKLMEILLVLYKHGYFSEDAGLRKLLQSTVAAAQEHLIFIMFNCIHEERKLSQQRFRKYLATFYERGLFSEAARKWTQLKHNFGLSVGCNEKQFMETAHRLYNNGYLFRVATNSNHIDHFMVTVKKTLEQYWNVLFSTYCFESSSNSSQESTEQRFMQRLFSLHKQGYLSEAVNASKKNGINIQFDARESDEQFLLILSSWYNSCHSSGAFLHSLEANGNQEENKSSSSTNSFKIKKKKILYLFELIKGRYNQQASKKSESPGHSESDATKKNNTNRNRNLCYSTRNATKLKKKRRNDKLEASKSQSNELFTYLGFGP